jgi:hypothetical protein
MPKTTLLKNALSLLLFNATDFAKIADNTVTTPATEIYLSLHTDSPGVGGTQDTNEVAYTGYARVLVHRASGASGWTVDGGLSKNTSAVSWPLCTGAPCDATYWGIGLSAIGGSDELLYFGALTDPATLAIGFGITPTAAAETLTITEI